MATENKSKPSNSSKNNRKRKHYLPHNKPVKKGAYPLRPGVQGFFITCDGGKEHQASNEAINVIDTRRFSKLDSGCNGVVFIQMRKRDGDPSPKDIVQHMMTSLASTKKHVSRFLLRVLPVEVTCYTSDEEIKRAIKPVIDKYFPVESEVPRKFAVLYDARANTGIDRTKVIDAVAKSVPSLHKVDLANPDINIVVQIVKTVCLIGVVEKYKELAKYNIRQLTSPKQ
ncbi:UNVERIFIED_CONTAM: THUMP domain-containing protein 1 [Sesamum latifolium]|uniref:THUMP domain-containing protein 1 n=1 Tax=Sesamum latifolium TaxID=2727402 RepID=A0AAW2Y586_9LAMI